MKKSQANIELLYSIGAILFIFIIILLIYFDKNTEIKKTKDFIERRDECLKISSFILEAFINDLNITTVIYHNLSIIPNERLIYIGDISCTIPINKINTTSIRKGSINIYEENDLILIK